MSPAPQPPAPPQPSSRTPRPPAARSIATSRRRRRGGPPSPALIFVPPLILSVGVIGVAALHGAMGSPFGATWAAEVWGLAKTAITAMLAVTGFGAYAHRNNQRAWELAEGERGADGDPAPLPPSAPRAGPPASASMRQRRTGRLTPVEDLRAPVAPAQKTRAVHAGERGGPR